MFSLKLNSLSFLKKSIIYEIVFPSHMVNILSFMNRLVFNDPQLTKKKIKVNWPPKYLF